ncbi:MAG: hypothetical protein OXG56_03925 [Gammaproteobacteria bacterium]|nr:hypothetical protein [Gammaproteobacteria bacterium]
MPESRGFVDLRIGHGAAGIGDESIWPSFTDIMTVIVMIFMMALVIIMVRNFELNRELVSTISAKEATTLAREKLAAELTELSGLLEDAENRGALLQADLDSGLKRLADLTAEHALLASEHETVVRQREQLEQANLGLEADRKASLVEIVQLNTHAQMLNRQIDTLSRQLATLQVQSDEQIASLTEQKQGLGNKLDTVSGQLDDLRAQFSRAQSENQALSRKVEALQAGNLDAEQRYRVAREDIRELEELVRRRESEIAVLEADQEASRAEVDDLHANVQALNRQIEALSRQLAALEIESGEQIASISEEKRSLSENLETVSGQLDGLRAQLARLQAENQALVREVGALQAGRTDAEQRYTVASEGIRELKELVRRQESENAELAARSASSHRQFESLQDEYDRLTEEYRRLIRAARSPAGKYVVEVQLEKSPAGFVYRIREPGDRDPAVVTKSRLEQKLQAIKAQKGASLYTKIVIPGDNQLTHNEAWQFTWEILRKYDYYYQ